MYERKIWSFAAALACCAPSCLTAQGVEAAAIPGSPCAPSEQSANPSVVPEDGVTAIYAFKASRANQEELQSFITRVVGGGFGYVNVVLPSGSRLFVSGSDRLSNAAAIADELARACRLQRSSSLILEEVQYQGVREKMRLAQEEARRQKEQHERRRLADEAFLREPPYREDIDKALRPHWKKWARAFHLEGALFGRVRDSKCGYVDGHGAGHFDCWIGVTATSTRGPEYEQGLLHVRRPGDGTLEIFYPAATPPT